MAFALPSTITMHNAAATAAALLAAVKAGERTVDLSAVTQSDSSLVAMLLEARRTAADVQVINVPARVAQLAALYDVGEFIARDVAASSSHHT
jgi:phospholipid transport system transporter-binding protein